MATKVRGHICVYVSVSVSTCVCVSLSVAKDLGILGDIERVEILFCFFFGFLVNLFKLTLCEKVEIEE